MTELLEQRGVDHNLTITALQNVAAVQKRSRGTPWAQAGGIASQGKRYARRAMKNWTQRKPI